MTSSHASHSNPPASGASDTDRMPLLCDTIIQGDALTVLKTFPDEFIDCCVTSPPYWGLRAYGTNPQIWGGDKDCQHEWQITLPRRERHVEDVKDSNSKQATNAGANCELSTQNICSKCHAWRGELGLEPTPELYVQHIVEVFREVKRVLRDDGTFWMNIGDSYANNGVSDPSKVGGFTGDRIRRGVKCIMDSRPKVIPAGLKPKDLCMIPARVALALQADGWWLRQDIIWVKPNPMPESVTDRCTKSHEYIFLLSKSAKYFYDADAIKEPYSDEIDRYGGDYKRRALNEKHDTAEKANANSLARVRDMRPDKNGRNKRSVWTITTKPFSEAHFATFPPDLVEPMILAGCPEDGIVLDPFIGSGTVARVAVEHRRHYIGIDLNTEYVAMAEKRRQVMQRMF